MTRLLVILLALLWPAIAQAAKPAQPAPPAPLVPAMWEVTDGVSKVTLFGTVHTLPRGVDWFRPHVLHALDSADRLVLETVMPDSPAAVLPVVMKLARLPAARPEQERLPESWWPVYQRAAARLKPGPMEWYDTWFISLTLSNLQTQANGMDPRIGVEAVLSERARIRNLPIVALETMEEQLIYFDALTEPDQQQLLVSTLEELESSKGRIDAMIGDWMAGNTEALAARVNDDFERSPMLRRMLVEDRNARWAAWIAGQMKTSPGAMFVAVGAGHLAGTGSLVEELEKRGLQVKRVVPEVPKRKRKARR
jgi:uncharacterized protein YbaP (TraB family)